MFTGQDYPSLVKISPGVFSTKEAFNKELYDEVRAFSERLRCTSQETITFQDENSEQFYSQQDCTVDQGSGSRQWIKDINRCILREGRIMNATSTAS